MSKHIKFPKQQKINLFTATGLFFFLRFSNICMRLYCFLATLRFHSQNYYSLQRKNTEEAVVKAVFIVFNH